MRHLVKFGDKTNSIKEVSSQWLNEAKIITNKSKLSKADVIIPNIFKRALSERSVSVSDDFTKEASEYHVYKDYYVYDGIIFSYSQRPSGDWYHTEITKSSMTRKDLLEKIEKEIEELEEAYNKLYSNDL
jgi:hypothetical protein